MNEQVWWYLARASGLVAWTTLTASVLWGVALSTRLVGRAAKPAWLLDLHRFLGGFACVLTGVHLASLVADSWIRVGWLEMLVPMSSSWRPGPIAWGVVSLYVLVVVELTSLLGRRVPKRVWRRIHLLSFVLWVTATVHTLTAGTDATHPMVLALAWTSVAAVLFAGIVRVLSPKPDRPDGARSPARGVQRRERARRGVVAAGHGVGVDAEGGRRTGAAEPLGWMRTDSLSR